MFADFVFICVNKNLGLNFCTDKFIRFALQVYILIRIEGLFFLLSVGYMASDLLKQRKTNY